MVSSEGADAHPELTAAVAHARRWLDGVAERPIPASRGAAEVGEAFPELLPERGGATAQVVEDLVAAAEPGLMASQSPRFYGWVMGGTLPASLAADWLVS